jgi:NAD+ diphosphatase
MRAVDLSIVFSGSPLDRAEKLRRDESWLAAARTAEASRFLLLHKLEVLCKAPAEGGATAAGQPARSLAFARAELLQGLAPPPPAYLLGVAGGAGHFAVDVSALEKPVEELGLTGLATFEDLRAMAAALPPEEAAIAAHARSLVDWHARHRHCAACGGPTRDVFGGSQRICIDCAAEHFPRTDPVAIALVVRGDECLLGRGHNWPPNMYSALAGYIEHGETLEDAVRREIFEESGVLVGTVRYLASQPWPFPSSLMIGCLAEAETEAITLDTAELADAAWFSKETVHAALAGPTPALIVPPAFAIAHQLMRAWAS